VVHRDLRGTGGCEVNIHDVPFPIPLRRQSNPSLFSEEVHDSAVEFLLQFREGMVVTHYRYMHDLFYTCARVCGLQVVQIGDRLHTIVPGIVPATIVHKPGPSDAIFLAQYRSGIVRSDTAGVIGFVGRVFTGNFDPWKGNGGNR